VYSCGYNAKGQLGLGDERSVTVWTHVTALQGKRTVKIFAGGDHSWAILGIFWIIKMNSIQTFATISLPPPSNSISKSICPTRPKSGKKSSQLFKWALVKNYSSSSQKWNWAIASSTSSLETNWWRIVRQWSMPTSKQFAKHKAKTSSFANSAKTERSMTVRANSPCPAILEEWR